MRGIHGHTTTAVHDMSTPSLLSWDKKKNTVGCRLQSSRAPRILTMRRSSISKAGAKWLCKYRQKRPKKRSCTITKPASASREHQSVIASKQKDAAGRSVEGRGGSKRRHAPERGFDISAGGSYLQRLLLSLLVASISSPCVTQLIVQATLFLAQAKTRRVPSETFLPHGKESRRLKR